MEEKFSPFKPGSIHPQGHGTFPTLFSIWLLLVSSCSTATIYPFLFECQQVRPPSRVSCSSSSRPLRLSLRIRIQSHQRLALLYSTTPV
ncbi:hypothetical protein DL96DRAFT_1639152, partial [Flagelloscypha sp. PMI_526]